VCSDDEVNKVILRANWLLQKLYIASSARGSHDNFIGWLWDDNLTPLHILHTCNPPASFFPFSPPASTTEQERKMILSAMMCTGAVADHGTLLELLLKGAYGYDMSNLAV
jgi:hypothetical protein